MSIQQPGDTFSLVHLTSLTDDNRAGQRTFDLHPALFGITVGAFLAYIGVMAAAFASAEIAIPFAICIITIVAAFAVPAMWVKVAARPVGRVPDWNQFIGEGVETFTGHVSGKSAVCQVLLMPVVILVWGVIIAVIQASIVS